MPLSEYEQQILEQMEKSLTSDDPNLATKLAEPTKHSTKRYVVTISGTLVGVAILGVGVAQSLPLLGIVGFLVLFAAIALAFAVPPKVAKKDPQPVTPAGSARAGKSAKKSGRSKTLLQAFEERWDRRQNGG